MPNLLLTSKSLVKKTHFFLNSIPFLIICISNITIEGKPGPVENLRVAKVTEDSVSLKWEAVSNDGGSKVTQYVVEKREQGKRSWTQVDLVDDLECTARKLAVSLPPTPFQK